MPSQRVKDLAESIVQVHVSYGFTDWHEAIKECIDSAGEMGETYTEAETEEAGRLASTMSAKLKQSYDTITKEVLG